MSIATIPVAAGVDLVATATFDRYRKAMSVTQQVKLLSGGLHGRLFVASVGGDLWASDGYFLAPVGVLSPVPGWDALEPGAYTVTVKGGFERTGEAPNLARLLEDALGSVVGLKPATLGTLRYALGDIYSGMQVRPLLVVETPTGRAGYDVGYLHLILGNLDLSGVEMLASEKSAIIMASAEHPAVLMTRRSSNETADHGWNLRGVVMPVRLN